VVPVLSGCGVERSPQTGGASSGDVLVGAWRSRIGFRTGPLAEMRDLEFLYAYNAGGTMTESSNYDEAANSSPPAYGVWRATEEGKFETKYVFYTTEAPGARHPSPGNGDWWPAGYGVLTETLTLADDGRTYASTVKLVTFDPGGKPIPGGAGEGTGAGTRIMF
jgi:hypothetical protein